MAEASADPVSAIANAAGDIFGSIGNIWTSIVDKKTVKEQGKNLDKLTEQELIKYNLLISSGNTALADKLLAAKSAETAGTQKVTYIILAALFVTVLVIVYFKFRRK